MVDPETFSMITQAYLKRKSYEAREMIKFREKLKKIKKQNG